MYEFIRHGEPEPCISLNPQKHYSTMTVPIVGMPRGGTTMVAAVVHSLGLDIGPAEELAKHTFEDHTMSHAQPGAQLAYIAKRNQEHLQWGWKDPLAISTVRSLFFALRNPRVIIVFRDSAATIESEMRYDIANNIQPRRIFPDLVQATMNWWKANMEFVQQSSFPLLLVSYERALHMPDRFLAQLTEFLGMSPTPEGLREAKARINLDGGYLTIDKYAHPVSLPEVNKPPEPDESAMQ